MTRILIVEDESDIAGLLAEDLRVEGHQVEIAGDGESALGRAREPGWDLILLDVMLPRKDGFEVCRELRRARIRTPIILLTAKAQEAVFIRHHGRVLSRQQLIDEAWGQDTFVTDRVVDSHIVNLRRKIEPKPRTPRYLVSVRGLGYRFDG